MTEITYSRQGSYNLPDLLPPQEPGAAPRRHALLRRKLLKRNRRITYISLLTSGRLNDHLAKIKQAVSSRMDQAVTQMARTEGVTEELRARDPMEWV